MTTFIAIVQGDRTGGYTASFPDFPQCCASSPTLEEVIKQAREALLQRIEGLLEAGQAISSATTMEAIQRRGDTLFAAVEVPDDLRSAQLEMVIPALSLARMESFADRHGLSLAALFVKAVDRWAAQEAAPGESGGRASDGPTLFDFASPAELRVEAAAAEFGPPDELQTSDDGAAVDSGEKSDSITAQLVRLIDDQSEGKRSPRG
jgi:predicted RNase H-like HicB family nuclease